jgi:hypothetical protein
MIRYLAIYYPIDFCIFLSEKVNIDSQTPTPKRRISLALFDTMSVRDAVNNSRQTPGIFSSLRSIHLSRARIFASRLLNNSAAV